MKIIPTSFYTVYLKGGPKLRSQAQAVRVQIFVTQIFFFFPEQLQNPERSYVPLLQNY